MIAKLATGEMKDSTIERQERRRGGAETDTHNGDESGAGVAVDLAE
jgi:hypothetical protein